MRLTPNLHVGLVLGIATASVVLALGGCAISPDRSQPSAAPATAPSAAALERFSESERERILAVQSIVEQAAAEHGIDPDLINAVIWVESKFEPDAKSSAGARGLMQLMPATAAYLAKRMGEHNPRSFDPEFNVRAGSLYLAEMIAKFGDEQHAVAAYHAGPGNVKRWLETGEAFPEYSRSYVAKVMDARVRFEGSERHGGTSAARGPVAARSEPESKAAVGSTPVADDEPLEAPDLSTIPTVAEVHGLVEPEPEPKPAPVVTEAPIEVDIEPVFVVHDELDANPNAKHGWVNPDPAAPRREVKPKRGPAPRPKPSDDVEPEQAGLGVLPDL